ncbi:MAG: thiamine pyrophosphate-binding protein [Chloroflexi bacterium]|nr:thiamine pyrophosphate-binding protein [Chloroflexota bacterium]
MKVFEALAEGFLAEGTRESFGVMGDGNMEWSITMEDRYATPSYQARHEDAAVAMASGAARASGRVGVATVTSGPGLTQIGTSLMTAARHRVPLVVLAGDSPDSLRASGSGWDMNQRAFIEACGALWHPLRSAHTVAADVQRAFLRARTERMPVVLNAPMDIQEADLPGRWSYTPSTALLPSLEPIPPAPASVGAAVDMIGSARRVIIIAGEGAVASGARDVLEKLADRIGALVGTTVPAKGWFDGNPWSLAIVGAYSHPHAEHLVAQADLVIAVGASLSAKTTRDNAFFAQAKVIQIDVERQPAIRARPAHLLIVGDARLTAETILTQLERDNISGTGYRTDERIVARLDADREVDLDQTVWPAQPGTVDARRFMLTLDPLLPRDAIVVIGLGHFWSFPTMYLSGFRSRQFIYCYGFSAIGQGFATAIGAALSGTGRPVIAFEGDAAALMHIQELDTVRRHGARLQLFVMNDEALAAEYHRLPWKGHSAALSAIGTPSFARVAAGFDIGGADIRSLDDVAPVVDAFKTGAQVVDVHLLRSVVSRPFRNMAPADVRSTGFGAQVAERAPAGVR